MKPAVRIPDNTDPVITVASMSKKTTISGRQWSRVLQWFYRAVPVFAALFFLGWCYVSLRTDFDWDDADPEILNQAWRMTRGEEIYRGIDSLPFAFAAYTPLYYALVALLLKLTGLSFLPAKLVSFLSALSIGWAMASLSRKWSAGSRAGFMAACILFLVPAFLYNAARCHPQMLSVALSVWSLVFFIRNRWPDTVIISPLLAVLAFYTKQTQVALPLAMAVYLAFRNRRWLLPYVSTLTVAGVLPFLWLQKISGGYFFYDTVYLARLPYEILQVPPVFLHHAGPLLIFMVAALLASWQRLRTGRWEPIDCYLAVVLVTTLVSLGRLGAHGQYVLELLVVTMILLLRICGSASMQNRDMWASLQILFLLIYAPLFIFVEEGLFDMQANRAAQKIYPLIEAGTGPVLSQQGSFALFGRGEISVQLFHFTALSRVGIWDQGLLIKEIDKRTFSWVITEFPLEETKLTDDDHERFTREMLEALRANYRRRHDLYPYYLYSPFSLGTD